MTNYTNVRISEGQKDKLKKAFESNFESITIRLTMKTIAITKSQLDRLMKAYEGKN